MVTIFHNVIFGDPQTS